MSSVLEPPADSPHGQMAALLDQLHSVIDDLQQVDLTGLADSALVASLDELERAARRVPSVRSGFVAEVSSRGIPAARQFRSPQGFLRARFRLSPQEASSWVRDAEATVPPRALTSGELLPPARPFVADAVAAGEISPEQSRLIVRTMDAVPAAVPTEQNRSGERTLVESAGQFDPAKLSRLCATFLACVDPDGSLGTQEERDAKRFFTIGRQDRHGMYPVRGSLDPETGALLKATLDPLARPQHTATERDDRTTEQRNHDALRELGKLALGSDHLPRQGGVPATLFLIATLEQIEQRCGLVSTLHGGLLPVEDVIRQAAQMRVIPMVFDSGGQPLHCGRETRLATPSQRYTLYALDRGCVIPDCDQPAMRTEVHHLIDWAKGGETDIGSMGLLCPYHHHRVDGWTFERRAGRVWCTPPPWLDPAQVPKINNYFYLPDLFSG